MDKLSARYERFANIEANGSSPLYEALALHVAQSDRLLRFLETLPEEKRQPNLLLAAVRHVGGLQHTGETFENAVFEHEAAIRNVMLNRSTQTNEAGRCAVLMPVLANIPGPIALLEVGASAGLCLKPDYYAYEYHNKTLIPSGFDTTNSPTFQCDASANTPLPETYPNVVWRAGLDLNPLDINNDDDVSWLKTLIWPEHTQRAHNLELAIKTARLDPPKVYRGNLLTDLSDLAKRAPKDATLVIFHTAVLSYIAAQSDRESFAATATQLSDYWISNEAPRVFDRIIPPTSAVQNTGRFLLSVNSVPMAWTHPHGKSITWI